MTGDDTPRERLVRVEEQIKHINAKLDTIGTDVGEMKDAFTQGKGAFRVVRYGQYVMAGLIGYMSTYLPKITTLISGLPK
jgi:hypothetical protein